MPSWLSAAITEQIASPPKMISPPDHEDLADIPSPSQIQETERKRLPSPMPTLRSKKPRTRTPRCLTPAINGPSAYTFGEDDDPDAKWSTFGVSRKKATTARRSENPRGMKQSGGFRLPLVGLGKKPVKPKTEPIPEVKRRVVTYLPPPMTIRGLVDDSISMPGTTVAATDNTVPETILLEENDILATTPEGDEDARGADVTPFTMDSDGLTLVDVDYDEELVFAFDVDEVCARYPVTRAQMKEVRSTGC
ncbi:hypothetical protein HYDPIDRAFT_112775 [Hydnomerulius pinastri MD-312]|uniref:Uncharacterized protein n=1 Tax=Hydnomerulius pinastri MD-312 TaxID=994086 RepID=A0A0C9WF13_9AGAM|nr:hypothetical protein HYDPIDRAFT_112775 [Hydnomerulius pinastri MD-312]